MGSILPDHPGASRLILAIGCTLAACQFSAPDYRDSHYRCAPVTNACPDGFTCHAGVCASPGADPDAGGADAGAVDASRADASLAPDGRTALQVVFVGADATAAAGGTGGSPADEACPAGQALIGFTGSLTAAGGFHSQIAAACGAVTLVPSASGYVARVGPGATLPQHGTPGTAPWTRTCPADQVVIGFGGRAGLYMDALQFVCAPFVVTSVTPPTLTVGAAAPLTVIGGTGGGAFAEIDCPAGEVATIENLRSGDFIDSFAVSCGAPIVAP